MILELLIQTCAVPNTPPAVIEQIITVESGEQMFAINVNSETPIKVVTPTSLEDAVKLADKYIAEGYSVDMGYMQVNSQHLGKYNVTVKDVFDPCQNLYIGSDIFMRGYTATKSYYGDTPLALKTALSAYNTGTFHRGFENGYNARYEPQDAQQEPAKQSGDYEARHSPMSVRLDFSNPYKKKAPPEGDALEVKENIEPNDE